LCEAGVGTGWTVYPPLSSIKGHSGGCFFIILPKDGFFLRTIKT